MGTTDMTSQEYQLYVGRIAELDGIRAEYHELKQANGVDLWSLNGYMLCAERERYYTKLALELRLVLLGVYFDREVEFQ